MKKLILILCVFAMASCTTKKKAVRYFDNHQDVSSEYCANKYPVIPEYIKGKDSVITKEIEVKGDSIPCPANEKGEVIKVKCPDKKVEYKEVFRVDTIVKENTAKTTLYQTKFINCDIELNEIRAERNRYLKGIIGLTIVLLGLIYALIRK